MRQTVTAPAQRPARNAIRTALGIACAIAALTGGASAFAQQSMTEHRPDQNASPGESQTDRKHARSASGQTPDDQDKRNAPLGGVPASPTLQHDDSSLKDSALLRHGSSAAHANDSGSSSGSGRPSVQPDASSAPPGAAHDPQRSSPEHRTTPQETTHRGAQPDTHPQRRAAARRPMRHDLQQKDFRDTHGGAFQVPTNDRVRIVTDRHGFDWGALDKRQILQGCPPALAKGTGCAPPPPAVLPTSLATPAPPPAWTQPGWYMPNYDRNQTYGYADGYLLRMGAGNSVTSAVPLLGGALSVGAVWPSAFQGASLPDYYDSYYGLGAANGYRYYADALYRISPQTNAITAIAALLTGNTIAVGKVMPEGYDIYNVPYGYRDQYVDGPKALYRYSDGYIYQLDPETRMVRAAIEMLD